ncbi:MAG: RNA 2',3'-cyclic phosphodiesterase [Nitrospirae bacterium]|nr:RNA 2',3'-cyclic phosphodiesterase [Nitrospirota bacterium]
MSIRTFIAIELSSEVRSKLTAIQEILKKSGAYVRWVEPGNIHLTLKFLGSVSPLRLEDVFNATDEAIEKTTPFLLSFSGLGAFPKLDNPRVVWVGAEEGGKILSRIQQRLETNLKRRGFPAEEREYHPHLTLGRVKSSKNKDKLIEAIKAEKSYSLGAMKVKKITVMQSILKPGGPEYKPLHVSKIKEFRQD